MGYYEFLDEFEKVKYNIFRYSSLVGATYLQVGPHIQIYCKRSEKKRSRMHCQFSQDLSFQGNCSYYEEESMQESLWAILVQA